MTAKVVEQETVQARWDRAVRAIRKRGVLVRQNVPGCCRSCIGADPDRLPHDKPVLWTYGGQGHATVWHAGVLVSRADRDRLKRQRHWWSPPTPTESVYWNHSSPTEVNAALIAKEEFERAGFVVDWDGSEHKTVTIVLVDPKPVAE